MSTLIRWEPAHEFRTLRDTMDRLFEDTFNRPSTRTGGHREPSAATLGLDIFETGDEFVLTAAIPGVNPDDVEVSVDDDLLTISGHSSYETVDESATYHRRELRGGEFRRVLRLPPTINAEAAGIEFEHGLLKLTLPKRPEARSRSFKIKAPVNDTTVEAAG
ncbi:MAG: Hsp20/alpha crystallin family protein [Dehalococcoidia bacterium]